MGNKTGPKNSNCACSKWSPRQRHRCKKQRGKWEKSHKASCFEKSPDGKHFSSQSPASFLFPDMKGRVTGIGIDKVDFFQLQRWSAGGCWAGRGALPRVQGLSAGGRTVSGRDHTELASPQTTLTSRPGGHKLPQGWC